MKKIVWLLLSCAYFITSSAQNRVLDNRLIGLDTQITALISDYHAAGVAIAVIENGTTLYSDGFGYRDFDKKLPVDGNTVFGIGSVTKSFTASLLGILADKGELSLRDRPSMYIPELKFHNPHMDHAIQIRNLLTHSTGIARFDSECSSVLFQSSNKADLIPRLEFLSPTAQVGEQFMYSNYMYTVASIITERVTGKSWAQNLANMIFESLEMHHTYSGYSTAKNATNLSLAYSVDKDNPVEVLPEIVPTRAPAGSIFSTVNDLAKWVKTWMNEGKYDDRQVLPSTYVEEAMRPQQIVSGGPQSGASRQAQFFNYGYGWFNSEYLGYYKVEHSGGVSGYTSNIAFFPTEGIGIIVLTNQNTSSLAFSVTDIITDKMLKVDSSGEESAAPSFTRLQPLESAYTQTIIDSKKPTSHALAAYAGKYSHPAYGEFLISLEDGVLLAACPFTTLRLSHEGFNAFDSHFTKRESQVLTASFLRFNFRTNFAGEVNSVMVNVSQEGVEFERVE